MKKIVFWSNLIGGVSIFSLTEAACISGKDVKDVETLIKWASCLLDKMIIPFLFILATVAFIWGVFQFYLNPENEEKRKKGKSFIIGGLIALFVMLSVWGIVKIFTGTFGLSNTIPQLPQTQN